MEIKTIKIKYFEPGLVPLEKIAVGDWIDLRCAEHIEMKKDEYYPIRLGVGMILPKGYEALVLPRSSTFNSWGVICVNGMGVIDNSYSGVGGQGYRYRKGRPYRSVSDTEKSARY